MPRFLHRRVAGNMQPLTRGDADMIHGRNQWLLILVRRYFKKFPAVVSKKLEFGHLRVKGENDDDDLYAEKIFWRRCHFARFFPCRGEGYLVKCQRDLRLGKKVLLMCFQNR